MQASSFGVLRGHAGRGIVMMGNRYAEAYIKFLVHFHGDRDYFECHEVLEDYWKEHPESPYSITWVGLIQSAVAMYHYRRGNIAGAVKLFTGALEKFREEDFQELGIDAARWRELLVATLAKLRRGEHSPYADIDIPIQDPQLKAECEARCRQLGLAWGSSSDVWNENLIHRHIRRDRTEVIEERQRQLEQRGGR